jgi:hypothetical protein
MLECLSLEILSSLVKILQIRPEPIRGKHISVSPRQDRLQALPINSRLSWTSVQGTSLLRKFVNYDRKRFYNIGPWTQRYKTFNIRNL